jgi:hypothetical protein
MHPPTHSASPDMLILWLTIAAFGIYHGLNPAMGWLFALAQGLQQNNARAIWVTMLPITIGHALSVALAAAMILAIQPFLPMQTLQLMTAGVLLAFGIYKLITWYRHPRWVGMRMRWHELTGWSFIMATAHGAGLMVAPALLGVMTMQHDMPMPMVPGASASLAVGLHTLAMLLTMVLVAWIVYQKLGIMVLRQTWINFDLIWAFALIIVGGISLIAALQQHSPAVLSEGWLSTAARQLLF